MRLLISVIFLAIFWASIPIELYANENADHMAQLNIDLEEKRSKPEKSKKLSQDLKTLHGDFEAHKKQKGKSFKSKNKKLKIHNERVLIELIVSNNVEEVEDFLRSLGATKISSSNYLLSAYVPISELHNLESVPSVVAVAPSYSATLSGSVTSQGDIATRAFEARNLYGLDGSGVVIGTLSDSLNCLGGAVADVANDDLPVGIRYWEVSNCTGAIDEGRAMMQIIHDLAPGTTQMFQTAWEGQPAFADAIRNLAYEGADIIVDDIIYLSEPFFQDGIIAQAVDEVSVNQGVAYFSAAGNYGTQSYQAYFNPDSVYASYHDFGSSLNEDIFQKIYIPSGESVTLILQWAEPFASVSGPPGAASDFDIMISDDPYSEFLAISQDANIGADPVEILNFTNSGASQYFNVIINRYSGSGSPLLKYVYIGPMSVEEYATQSSTVFGHANALWAEAIGSVDYWQTPVYGVEPPLINSSSGRGGTPILFDIEGNAVSETYRKKPNFSCVHGGNTTFFGGIDPEGDGWPNFFGTSAAAPHAAAMAALIKQYQSDLNALEILTVLENSAVDMDAAGFDFVSGAGLCDATGALKNLEEVDISLSVSADPTELAEPGGAVNFTVTVKNIGSAQVTVDELSDDAVGSLNGLGSCSVPQVLSPEIGIYSCSYTLYANGNAGDNLPLNVSASAIGVQNMDSESAQASVTLTDVFPSAVIGSAYDPATLPEPGGASTVSVAIQNTGTAEPITLATLSDSALGDLNGHGSCTTGIVIEPGAIYECTYPVSVSGNAGAYVQRSISASIQDDELNELDLQSDVGISIIDVLPQATLEAAISPSSIRGPSGTVTVSVIITNASPAEHIDLTSLVDEWSGDLNGIGTCLVPQEINAGERYQCQFSVEVSGSPGESLANRVTATIQDDELNSLQPQGEVEISIWDSSVIFLNGFE